MSERMRELLGFLISMAALHDADMAKQFADELEELFAGSILCDAEPVWYEITARDGTQCVLTTQPVLLGHTSEPLYKAKEVGK